MIFIAKVSTELQREFLQAMVSLQEDKKKERGLKDTRIYWDVHEENRFSLIDEWASEKDLRRYLDGESYRVLVGALKVLCTEVEINCGEVGRLIESEKDASSYGRQPSTGGQHQRR